MDCVPVGPVVFFSGFTRKFLAGETRTSDEMLRECAAAVDALAAAEGRRLVVVDGVGYPAVGSICGVDNASIASAVGASCVLVGKKGVGDAVDSFNQDACWFEARNVPVLGAVFNRLPEDGYYSLERCALQRSLCIL